MGRLDRTRGVGVSVGTRPGTRSWDDRRRALVLGMGWHDWGPGLDCLCLSEGVPLCRHEKEKRHNAFRCEPPPRRPSCLPLPFLGALSDGFLLFSSSLFLVSSVPCHPLPPGRSTQARTLARTTTAAPSTSRGPLESRRGPKGCVGSLGSLGKRGGVNKKTGVDGWMDVVFSPGCVELRACAPGRFPCSMHCSTTFPTCTLRAQKADVHRSISYKKDTVPEIHCSLFF